MKSLHHVFAAGVVLAGSTSMTPPAVASVQSPCDRTLAGFVVRLDQALGAGAGLDALQTLLHEFFPMSGCDPRRAVSIARGSKYFSHAGPNGTSTVIAFNNGSKFGRRGFWISFGLRPETGDSYLPAVRPISISPW